MLRLDHAPDHRSGLHTQPSRELKGRALPWHRFHPNAATHQRHQVAADRQPQAGAAIAARGGAVNLAEALEQPLLLCRAHTDAGVAHLHMQLDTAVVTAGAADADHHLAGLGELAGVAAQVEQHLLQAQRVADQRRRHVGRQVNQQLEPLVLHLDRQHVDQRLQHVFQPEIDVFDVEFARFNFGEIQNVVDQAQQPMRRTVRFLHIVALPRVQVGLQRQLRHADDGVHRGADLVAHVGQKV